MSMGKNSGRGSVPEYGVTVDEGVMIPLRDGIRCASDIYFPAGANTNSASDTYNNIANTNNITSTGNANTSAHGNTTKVNNIDANANAGQNRGGIDGAGGKAVGEFPVILHRTPYNRKEGAGIGKYYAERGYVAVMQDVRGRYDSEGEFYAFANEGPDGYDVVEWIAAQNWCDGKVGTLGQSYCGADQSALACMNPPHLASMIVGFGPSSYFHSSLRHNGALETRFFIYAFTMATTSREALADPTIRAALDEAYANIWEYVKAGPLTAGTTPLRLVPSYEKWCIDICTRATYDEFWQKPGWGPRPHYDVHADVPTLYVGGWYDTYTRSTLENYVALSERQKSPVHVLMGPWTHGGVGVGVAGDARFRRDGSLPSHEALRLQWFDATLKGMENGILDRDPVQYFVMGGGTAPVNAGKTIYHGGEWKSAKQWPIPEAEATDYYLHGDGKLSTEPPAGECAPTEYTFDPDNPVPTIGGQLSAIPVPAGAFDQRNDSRFPFSEGTLPLSARPDVLCYMTEPLAENVEVTGPVTVSLWVSTDAPDTDFTAKLIDMHAPSGEYPDGCAMLLGDSIMRLRFRNGFEQEELAEPGEVYKLQFALYPTSNLFVKGHRIRIDISSSNFPRFDVNPNTGGPIGVERRTRKAENSLHHGKSTPSHVTLHVVKR